jgi:hypothetical protein
MNSGQPDAFLSREVGATPRDATVVTGIKLG